MGKLHMYVFLQKEDIWWLNHPPSKCYPNHWPKSFNSNVTSNSPQFNHFQKWRTFYQFVWPHLSPCQSRRSITLWAPSRKSLIPIGKILSLDSICSQVWITIRFAICAKHQLPTISRKLLWLYFTFYVCRLLGPTWRWHRHVLSSFVPRLVDSSERQRKYEVHGRSAKWALGNGTHVQS